MESTAAFELTATPELRERFDVTLYQLGWRLGGKGASGRNAAAADRIEEHGLHVWFGFYDNAFRVMRDAYSELGRPAGSPLARLRGRVQGLRPARPVRPRRRRVARQSHRLPAQRPAPGRRRRATDLLGDGRHGLRLGARGAGASSATAGTTCRPRGNGNGNGLVPDWFEDLASDLAGELLEGPLDIGEKLLGLAERLAGLRARHTDHLIVRHAAHPALLVRLLKAFREWLWTSVVAGRIDRDPELRFYFTAVDAGVSTVAGIVEDGVLERGFDVINNEDWAQWLRRHGASELTIGRTPAERSPVLRSVYDVAFAYTGRSDRSGRLRGRHRRRATCCDWPSATAARSCTRCRRGWETRSSPPSTRC